MLRRVGVQHSTSRTESHSSSSNLTSSDKLTALPTQSTPVFDRLKTTGRAPRRSTDASLTSIDSASGSLSALHSLPDAIRQSESDSSVAKDTPRPRNESNRSLPTSFQNTRPGELFASPPCLALCLPSFRVSRPLCPSSVGLSSRTRRPWSPRSVMSNCQISIHFSPNSSSRPLMTSLDVDLFRQEAARHNQLHVIG